MMERTGLAQANTLRSNNTGANGYGIVYADEVSGHRTVKTMAELYGLHDWQLSASGDNTDMDAIGQLWYVVDADGDGNGGLYQLKDWEKRSTTDGWKLFGADGTADLTGYAKTADVDEKLSQKLDKAVAEADYVKAAELQSLTADEIDNLWTNS